MENFTHEKNSNSRSKKLIKVDMTPMVDLGFLLITFFMFTTNFSKPNVMDLSLPAGEGGTEIDVKNSINLILGKDHKIYYYQDELKNMTFDRLKEVPANREGLVTVIEKAKKSATKPEIFTILIKPTDDSDYKSFVDVLDEINISQVNKFGISEVKDKELKLYKEKTNQK